MRYLGVKLSEREGLVKLFKYDNMDDFLVAIGYGGVTTHQIALKLTTQQEPPKEVTEVILPRRPVSAIKVLGVGDMLTQLARCCHPVPGDRVIGYVTRSRGVTIHRQDCHNVINEDEKERLISVEWAQTDSLYPVSIQVEAWDRVGLMRDISTIVAEEKVNITAVNSTHHDGHAVTEYFALETRGLAQLSRLLGKVEGVRGVISVTRVGDEATVKANPST
jgi:GTP pyrophosphokinase